MRRTKPSSSPTAAPGAARFRWVSGRLTQAAASTPAPSIDSSQKLARQPANVSRKPPSTGATIGATTKAMVI